MADFDRAVNKLLRLEGGFSPVDVSAQVGAVNWGITQRFLRSIGHPASVEDVRSLSRAQAKGLYKKYFWDPLRLSEIKSQRIAETILFAAVNIGPATAVRILQRSLRAIDRMVAVDGILGPRTIGAINSLGDEMFDGFLFVYKEKLKTKYESLARSRPELYGRYLNGWLKRLEST